MTDKIKENKMSNNNNNNNKKKNNNNNNNNNNSKKRCKNNKSPKHYNFTDIKHVSVHLVQDLMSDFF